MRNYNRRGFTLIELLTVIGIIILLIGILIPVLRVIRGTSYATASQAAVMNLANAIERYRQDFAAYPGVISNARFATATGVADAIGSPAQAGMTMSENLFLALAGGWEPGSNPPSTSTLDQNQIGNGPMSHNPVASARRRSSPYFDVTPGVTVQDKPWNRVAIDAGVHGYASLDRANIPEFIDRFPDPLPILYLRARPGTTGVLEVGATPAQYRVQHIYPYIRQPAATNFPGSTEDVNNNRITDPGEDLNGNNSNNSPSERDFGGNATTYFTNPSIPNTARQKDGFILIGAGQDRKYGTRDDQTNFGPL